MQQLSYGEDAPDVINLVIEIQRGSWNKYEFDKEMGVTFLDRVNNVYMGYPADYGFVPNTLCEDGDPLDGLLIIDESVLPGIVVPARPIGVLYLVDDGESDEKLICVAENDGTKSHINSVEDLGGNFKKMLEHFYTHYKDWKNDWKGVDIKFNGWGDAPEAKQVIKDSIKRAL